MLSLWYLEQSGLPSTKEIWRHWRESRKRPQRCWRAWMVSTGRLGLFSLSSLSKGMLGVPGMCVNSTRRMWWRWSQTPFSDAPVTAQSNGHPVECWRLCAFLWGWLSTGAGFLQGLWGGRSWRHPGIVWAWSWPCLSRDKMIPRSSCQAQPVSDSVWLRWQWSNWPDIGKCSEKSRCHLYADMHSCVGYLQLPVKYGHTAAVNLIKH